ncbi:MAG: gliding motility-associated C-terminal domain-containing protein [Flavobacteriales bacterium]|nr:gliding motility-associated C-terminal domain-containing protein [Flavobacteriales bacterium]
MSQDMRITNISRPFKGAFILMGLWSASLATLKAQQFSIATPTITTCAGVLEDTGGPAGQYGNGENFTTVICADVPGDGISLNWLVADLSNAGPNPPDRIRIWDGDNTGETFLGEYTGSSLQGLVASATTFNTTGCLTVQFISNANGVGNFAAGITCFTPCERPTAVAVMNEPTPALVCVGEELTFDGTGSFAAPGFNIVNYEWDFDDGSTQTSPTATHSFAVPGEYIVQLNLIDDNDCVNSNVVDLQILVSTTPLFLGTAESVETCLGATVDLLGVVTPVTWIGLPDANFGGPVFLPDEFGSPFTSELLYTQFEPGQTLTDCADILSVCVEMEHTFMGDLVLQVICPNGQTTILHQQGGGGTYIGSPNDTDSNDNPIPGECWNYCWSETATNGTWVDNATFGAGNTTPAGIPENESLNPGTYEPIQSMCNLVGCPLNGTWTYQSTDLWGADNGFICSWSLNFDPSIIPEVTQFTPTIDTTDIDSAGWSGPFLTLDANTPTVASADPTGPGSYDYTFSVTDNFGCTYDTTITVTIAPQLEIDAGPDVTLCSDPEPMAGTIVANGPPTTCIWVLELYESFGDSWNGGASLTVTINGVSTPYTIAGSGIDELTFNLNVSTGDVISLNYTAGTIFNGENSFSLFDDAGGTVYASPNGPNTGMAYQGVVACGGGAPVTVWEWTPTDGLDDPSDPETDVYVTAPTWYYLSAYPIGNPECAVMDSVQVIPDPSIDAGLSAVLEFCAGTPDFLMTDSLLGTPDTDGVWTDATGNVFANTFQTLIDSGGVYTYTVTSQNGCVATSTLDITVIPADDPTCCGIPDAGEPLISCDLTNPLTATPGNTGVGEWSGPAGAVFEDRFAPLTVVTVEPGMGGTHWFFWRENDGAFCNTVDSVQMTFTDPITIDFIWTDAICYNYCDGMARAVVGGGNVVGEFDYDWSNGVSGAGEDRIEDLCDGLYLLTVADDNGCLASDSILISEPVQLEIDNLTYEPVICSGDCNGKVIVQDARAVEYSFDNANTWSTSSVLDGACEVLYQVWIKDQAGCFGSNIITVTGPAPVVSDFMWGPQPSDVNNPSIRFINTSTGATRYEWDIAGLLQTTEPDVAYVFSNKEPGNYEVCLTSYNENECVDTLCRTVIIDDILLPYIPNSFTPDGDLLNDTWGMSVNIGSITDFEMLVYDRWGQVVFTSVDPMLHWLGSAQNSGEVLPQGVYTYRVTFEIIETQTRKELMGHVTLIK